MLVSSSHHRTEFSCAKTSKDESSQKNVIFCAKYTWYKSLTASCKDPKTALNKQALRVRYSSICSISAASRKLAKVDCPAEIAVLFPRLQGDQCQDFVALRHALWMHPNLC